MGCDGLSLGNKVSINMKRFYVLHNTTQNITQKYEHENILYIYCPPTKLPEGNVFSHACPSVGHSVHGGGGGGSYVTITHDGPASSQ